MRFCLTVRVLEKRIACGAGARVVGVRGSHDVTQSVVYARKHLLCRVLTVCVYVVHRYEQSCVHTRALLKNQEVLLGIQVEGMPWPSMPVYLCALSHYASISSRLFFVPFQIGYH